MHSQFKQMCLNPRHNNYVLAWLQLYKQTYMANIQNISIYLFRIKFMGLQQFKYEQTLQIIKPMSDTYHLQTQTFLSRYHATKKLDDLFSRGYTLCLDTQTNKRAILKFYSIETEEQEQAVLQSTFFIYSYRTDLQNFAKLNTINGICKLLSFAILHSNNQLMSAFQYDPLTLGQFVKLMKDPTHGSINYGTGLNSSLGMSKQDRLFAYLQIIRQMCKIISTSIEIGIEFDDINRQTIIIKQNLTPNRKYNMPSSGSIQSYGQAQEGLYSISLFYDQRQKQFAKIQNNELSNNNKMYWSPEKIQTQVLRNGEYYMQEGEESIYQLGLMMLDIVYQVQKAYQKYGTRTNSDGRNYQQDLKPDEYAIHTQSMLSYNQIDKVNKKAERNEPLITQRLNYLISSQQDCLKQLGILLRSMVMLMSEARPNIDKILADTNKILSLLRSRPKAKRQAQSESRNVNSVSPNNNTNGNIVNTSNNTYGNVVNTSNRNSIQPFRSLQQIQQNSINISQAQTLKNIGYVNSSQSSKNNISSGNQIRIQSNGNIGRHPQPSNDPDSLKYSDNSINHNSSQEFRHALLSNNSNLKGNIDNNSNINNNANNGSPSPIPYRKQGSVNPLSPTTASSDANKFVSRTSEYEPNRHRNSGSSPNASDYIKNITQLAHNAKSSANNSKSTATFIKLNQLLQFAKNHHESLTNQLKNLIYQLQQIKNSHPEKVLKKQYYDGSIYYGCFDQATKKKLGLGIYVYNSGDIYFGKWEDNALINGIYMFKNGESFSGLVKGGKQGQGTYRYANGNVYVGQWKDDLKNGRGVMTYPNGAKYQGQWLKGKKHGEGMYYYENGVVYRGGFALGKKYGNGLFIFPNGTKVQGFWDNNHLEGLAKIYYNNGDYYEGNFHMSEKSGEGTYRWSKGKGYDEIQQGQVQYKGTFKKDSLEGYAIIKFSNGEIYEGKVKNGKRNGQGIYKYSNGDQFKGQWKNDQKQMGRYKFSTGDQFQGKFKQGQMSFGLMRYKNGQNYQGQFSNGERNGIGAYSNKLGQPIYQGYWEKDQFKGSSISNTNGSLKKY